jgi:hypothetical protein
MNCKWVFTQWQWYYNKRQDKNTNITQNITPMLKQNTKYKATQTIKDRLHTMNTTKKVKLSLQQAVESLRDCEMLKIPHCPDNQQCIYEYKTHVTVWAMRIV